MYAQCPECLTFFHLKPSHLKAAQGRVRCSRCKYVFNALETLRDELTPEEIAEVQAARRREPKSDAPLLNEEYVGDLFDGLEYTETAELKLTVPAIESAPEPAPDAEDRARERPVHDFAPPRERPRRRRLYAALNLLLLFALAAQLAHWQRFELAAHPVAGPYLRQAYAALGLDLEPPPDLAAIKVSRTEVSSHPDHPRALYLTAVLSNTAKRPQPWPELYVDLQDRWGETVAARYFSAAEYLREPAHAASDMDAGALHTVELSVLDPGNDAVGFQIEPCFPIDTRWVCTADVETQR